MIAMFTCDTAMKSSLGDGNKSDDDKLQTLTY